MVKRLIAALAALAFATGAQAQTAPVPGKSPVYTKAPASRSMAYPYSGSGAYFGVGTLATQSNPTINGATAADLQAFGASLGGVLGYRWGAGNVAFAIEGSWYWNNLGGSAVCNGAACAVTSRFTSVERVKIIAPMNTITALFPNLGLPSMPALPTGLTPTSTHGYLFGGLKPDDISGALGLATGRAWQLSPGLGLGVENLLDNGAVVDVWAGYFNPTQGFTIGAPTGYVSQGRQLLAGATLLF